MHTVATVKARDLAAELAAAGWALVSSSDLASWLTASPAELGALAESWNDLPADDHLRDGGHYRFRRHACFTLDLPDAGGLTVGDDAPVLARTPHRAHWQPVTYNALHGGLERWFAPVRDDVAAHAVWRKLVVQLGAELGRVARVRRWYVEAHQFRVDTTGGIGRPTPEGAHRDGVDYVAVVLVGRQGIKGGETRVFEADGPRGVRFTLDEPWSALVLDDARVIHESTPIQPLGEHGHRDTLVLTYRADGFQSPDGG